MGNTSNKQNCGKPSNYGRMHIKQNEANNCGRVTTEKFANKRVREHTLYNIQINVGHRAGHDTVSECMRDGKRSVYITFVA